MINSYNLYISSFFLYNLYYIFLLHINNIFFKIYIYYISIFEINDSFIMFFGILYKLYLCLFTKFLHFAMS